MQNTISSKNDTSLRYLNRLSVSPFRKTDPNNVKVHTATTQNINISKLSKQDKSTNLNTNTTNTPSDMNNPVSSAIIDRSHKDLTNNITPPEVKYNKITITTSNSNIENTGNNVTNSFNPQSEKKNTNRIKAFTYKNRSISPIENKSPTGVSKLPLKAMRRKKCTFSSNMHDIANLSNLSILSISKNNIFSNSGLSERKGKEEKDKIRNIKFPNSSHLNKFINNLNNKI